MTDMPIKIARIRLDVEEIDGYACAMVRNADSDAPAFEVLRAPIERCKGDDAREAFMRLAASLAADAGTEFAQEQEAPGAPAPDDSSMQPFADFTVSVNSDGGFVWASLSEAMGMQAPTGAKFARIVGVAEPFMGSDDVQQQFTKLVEAVGIVLAQSMADERKQRMQ